MRGKDKSQVGRLFMAGPRGKYAPMSMLDQSRGKGRVLMDLVVGCVGAD